jgi:hypothetical protein
MLFTGRTLLVRGDASLWWWDSADGWAVMSENISEMKQSSSSGVFL